MEKNLIQAEQDARKVVNGWSIVAAGVGWVPGSMVALMAADVKLVRDVAKAFGVEHYNVQEVTAAIGASVTGKVVAGEALSLFPGLGWAIKSGVASAVTKTVGEVVISYFKKRSPYGSSR